MDRLKLFETAFRLGCGSSLMGALVSGVFLKYLGTETTLLKRHPRTTFRGMALRLGHLTMGDLFLWWMHQKYELRNRTFGKRSERRLMREEAKTRLRKRRGITSGDWFLRALLHTLGEELIRTATSLLPANLVQLAEEWRTATLARQQEIVGEVHDLLSQCKKETAKDDQYERNRHLSFESFLPRLCMHNELPAHLNCLGKAQLVAAFASLAGVRAYALHPVVDSATKRREFDGDIRATILRDLKDRPELAVPPEFLTTLKGNDKGGAIENHTDAEFHITIIVEMHEGKWALIDPNFSSGVLDDRWWNMPLVDRLLLKYGEVLPGLALPAGDGIGPDADKWYREACHQLEEKFLTSHILELAMAQALGGNFFEKVIASQQEYWKQRGFSREKLKRLLAEYLDLNQDEVLSWLFGNDLPVEDRQRMLADEQRVWQEFGDVLTLEYANELTTLRKRLWQFPFLQPFGEVGHCAYQLAIDVLGSTGCVVGWNWLADTFLVDHAYNQVWFSNTLRATESAGDLVAQQPRLRKKLKRLYRILYQYCNGHPTAWESIRKWKESRKTKRTQPHPDLKEVAQ